MQFKNKNSSPHQSPSVTAIPTPLCPFGAFPPDRGNRPPEGKPWAFANPPVRRAPLPPPLGEVSERSEGRGGTITTMLTLSVSSADSSPQGRAKELLQIDAAPETRRCAPAGGASPAPTLRRNVATAQNGVGSDPFRVRFAHPPPLGHQGEALMRCTLDWCGKIPRPRESRAGGAGFCFTSTGLPADREWLPFGRGWRCFWGGGRRLHPSAVLRRTPTAWRGRRSRKCSWHHCSSGCSCPRRR